MMSMFLERGLPTRKGYKRLRFSIAEYYNPDWTSLPIDGVTYRPPHDNEFFTITSLLEKPIYTLGPVADTKALLMNAVIEKQPELAG